MSRKKIYIGNRMVKKRYLGSKLIWQLFEYKELGRSDRVQIAIGMRNGPTNSKPGIQLYVPALFFNLTDLKQVVATVAGKPELVIENFSEKEISGNIVRIALSANDVEKYQKTYGGYVSAASVIFYG